MLATLLIGAVAVFVLGNLLKVIKTLRMPAHLRWELYPIPRGPKNKQSYGGSYFEESEWWTKSVPHSSRLDELAFILKEALLLKSVRENFRELWVYSLLLHWGLYLYFLSALALLAAPTLFNLIGISSRLVVFGVLGIFIGSVFGTAGALGLVMMRSLHPRLKAHSSRLTYGHLFLLGGMFVTCVVSLYTQGAGFAGMLSELGGRHQIVDAYSPATYVHAALLTIFLVYFPFSQLTHMFMKYFLWHEVRWNDTPSRLKEGHQIALYENLSREVTWGAPHIRMNERQTWADVVSKSGQPGGGQ